MCYLFYGLAQLFRLTYRFRYQGLDNLAQAQAHRPDKAYCLASWHEHALAGVLGLAGLRHTLLISKSKDGEFVDFIGRRLGYETARGSSSRGGAEARRVLLERFIKVARPRLRLMVHVDRGTRQKQGLSRWHLKVVR